MTTFDISTIEIADTITVEILHPATGEPYLNDSGEPLSVTVHAPGSPQYAAAQAAAGNRMSKRFRQKGKVDTTPEEDAAHKAQTLADLTISLNGFTYKGGDPTDRKTHLALYKDPKMGFITDKVNADAGDWGNCMAAA